MCLRGEESRGERGEAAWSVVASCSRHHHHPAFYCTNRPARQRHRRPGAAPRGPAGDGEARQPEPGLRDGKVNEQRRGWSRQARSLPHLTWTHFCTHHTTPAPWMPFPRRRPGCATPWAPPGSGARITSRPFPVRRPLPSLAARQSNPVSSRRAHHPTPSLPPSLPSSLSSSRIASHRIASHRIASQASRRTRTTTTSPCPASTGSTTSSWAAPSPARVHSIRGHLLLQSTPSLPPHAHTRILTQLLPPPHTPQKKETRPPASRASTSAPTSTSTPASASSSPRTPPLR